MAKTKREQLEKLVHDIQTAADDADAKGDFTVDERAAMTAMLTDAKRLKDELKAEAELTGDVADLKGFLGALAGKPTEPTASEKFTLTTGGLAMRPNGKTFGQLFTESEQYADFVKRYGGRDGIIKDSTKGIQSSPFQSSIDGKALITGVSSTSGGAFVVNDQYGPVTDLIGQRMLTVDDLVTKGTTDSDTVEFVRITGKTNAAAPVAEATGAGLLATTEAGGLTDAAGGLKPESTLTFERVSTTVKTIAHWMPITKRAASDASQVRTLVDNFLEYGLLEELEDQELNGSGAGENFEGISTAVTQTVASAGTDIDAIVDGIRTVRVTGRRQPTAVVFHPNDWYSTAFLLAKDSAGNYLIGDPRASSEALNSLWGLTVVVSEAQTENTALVGDFRWAVRWAREGTTISVSDSHADFFIRNLLAILAERRDAFGVLDIQAWCEVTGV